MNASNERAVLSAQGLRLGYGDLTAVWEASLEVFAGKTTAVVGRNGAGKTTLLSGLIGLLPAKSGNVTLEGADVTRVKPWQRVDSGMGIVQEGKRVFRDLTVQENLRLALPGGLGPRRTTEEMERLWTDFPVLSDRKTQLGGALSGGQQQMLSIASAVARRPKVLLIDEPSSGLSPIAVEQVFEVIDKLKQEFGMAILLVEQLVDEVLDGNADHVIVIDQGRILLSESAGEVTADQIAGMIFGAV
jgi:branched-chain amino acid transport system ATP-binding protein